MTNDLGLKLIAVMDINTLRLYQAEGLKITKELGIFAIHSDINHNPERHEGLYQKRSTQASSYDPHTAPKDIEYKESSKNAVNQISAVFTNNQLFKELVLVANPKMMGFCKQSLNNSLKKNLKKEIVKDLVEHNISDIEKAIFG